MSFPDEIERAYIMEKGILEGIFEHIVSIEQFDYLLGSWEDPLWDLVWQSEAYNSNESFLEYVNCYQHVGGKILPWLDEFLELVNDEKIDGVRNSEIARKAIAFQHALFSFREDLSYLHTEFFVGDWLASDAIKMRHTEKLHIKSSIDTHRELYESLQKYFGKPSPQSRLSESLQEASDNFNKKKILAESMGLEVNTTKKLTADSDSIPTIEQIKDYLLMKHPESYLGPKFNRTQGLSETITYTKIKSILEDIAKDEDIKPPTLRAAASKVINKRDYEEGDDDKVRKQISNFNLPKLVREKLLTENKIM
jgi:hypothetical protein